MISRAVEGVDFLVLKVRISREETSRDSLRKVLSRDPER